LMSISKIPSKYVKCPTCFKTPDSKRIQSIISDAISHRNNRPFYPEDPVIVTDTEVYCSSDCYTIAVIREEEEEQS
jgi:hypothetical protein